MRKALPTLIFLLGITLFVKAQPGSLDLSFDPGTGANSDIRATALQADGKIVIAGWFTDFNGYALNHIARLNSDGSVDTTYTIGTGADAQVYAMVLQADGKAVIGGDFTHYNGTAANRLARINTDGTLDTSFHVGTGPNTTVKALAMQTDNKIMTGGDFTSYNGTTRQRIARVNTDGSLDNTFNSASGFNGGVEVLRMQADGKVIVGGSFTWYAILLNGCLRFGRLNANGSFDSSFNPGLGGTSSTVYGLAVQPDTKILLGGDFVNYNASPMNHIARVQSNGAVDPGYFTGSGPNDGVNAIAVEPNGKLLIGGAFTQYDGVPLNRIIQLNADGHPDTANFKIGTGVPDRMWCITLQPDEKIIIGGSFTDYNGTSRRRIARLYGCFTTQPGTISGNDSTMCAANLTYSIAPVAGATSYEWTLPNGWTGSSNTTSITATSNGQGGIISVRAFNDTCGYSLPSSKTVYRIQPPSVEICLVTVDTPSTHNILIWEKPATTLLDSIFIYRETLTNVYTKIAAVHYDSLSEYHDYAANPNVTSYRYRISSLDKCGVESAQSPYHNTIHLQNLGGGNFQWTFYQIENASNPVVSFNFYRDNLANGNFFPIGNVPGTNATFTDNTYSSFPNADYVVDANWSISCTPSRGVNTTRSNIRHGFIIDTTQGINEELLEQIEIYPNPSKGIIHLRIPPSLGSAKLQLFNSMGQLLWSETPEGNTATQINTEALPKGVYTLGIETNMGVAKKKLIIQ